MKTALYIIAAMAAERNWFSLKRRLFIGLTTASSKEEAEIGSRRLFLEQTSKSDEYLNTLFEAEPVPESRIKYYCSQLGKQRDGAHQLVTLWAYAAFSPDRGGLHLGTIISQTKQDAEQEIVLRLAERKLEHRKHFDFIVKGIPPRMFLPQFSDPETALRLLRQRFVSCESKK